jgi:hypothetical protein
MSDQADPRLIANITRGAVILVGRLARELDLPELDRACEDGRVTPPGAVLLAFRMEQAMRLGVNPRLIRKAVEPSRGAPRRRCAGRIRRGRELRPRFRRGRARRSSARSARADPDDGAGEDEGPAGRAEARRRILPRRRRA